jgi:alcohol dehydrogenase class IV
VRPFDFVTSTRAVFGNGTFARLGEIARELGFARTLVVSDRGLFGTDLVGRATALLGDAGVASWCFHDFDPNPDTTAVEAGRAFGASHAVDSLVALGGGSSLDCAKGINFVLTNGGTMHEYRGFGKASRPMLPGIGIPTTAGTGSEAQSYAIISDAATHAKMACGDRKAAFRVAILDPVLTVTQPPLVTATAGYDAIAHAVECFVTTARNTMSDMFAREAWSLLNANYERVLLAPEDLQARGAMLLGAHTAGIAIEHSMLGATHACANPLTARYGTTHGAAIAVMLPHVVRWNEETVGDRYADLMRVGRDGGRDEADGLAARLARLARAGGLAGTLRELGVTREALAALAADAALQWTGTFNPRPLDAAAAIALYEQAF